MNQFPKFSIITINLNNKRGLVKTIGSVISQTYDDLEFIIIDGGSSDGSVDLIKVYSHLLKYWISEKDTGRYNAMNKGIIAATGDYCLFLNSGDYLASNDTLKKIAESLLEVDVIYGDLLHAKDGFIIKRINYPDKVSFPFLLGNALPHPCQFIKRDMFTKFGNYSEEYHVVSDYEFILRIFFTGKPRIMHLNEPITVFDLTGISNNPEFLLLNRKEKQSVQLRYFPAWLVHLYYGYDNFIHSAFMQLSLFRKPLHFINKLLLRLLKVI